MKRLKRILIPVMAIGFFISCSTDSSEIENTGTTNANTEESARSADSWPSGGSAGASWTIGRKSRNCFGIGICSSKPTKVVVKLDPLPPVIVYEQKMVSVIAAPNPRTLHLEFDDDYIRSVRLNFGGDEIILEEDFVLERETTEMIGLVAGFKIKAGRYPVVLNRETGRYDAFIVQR